LTKDEEKILKQKKILEDRDSEIKCLKQSHSVLENKITDLELQIDKLTVIIGDRDDTIKELKEELQTMKKCLKTAKSKVKDSSSMQDGFDEKVKNLEYKNKQLQSSLDEANDLKTIMKKKMKRKNKEVEKVNVEVRRYIIP